MTTISCLCDVPPKKTISCFWCDVPLKESNITKDHLISRPMKEYFGIKKLRSKYIEKCCRNCNSERAKITSLFQMVIQCQSEESGEFYERRHKTISKLRQKINNTIVCFRRKIEEKIRSSTVQKWCLKEIQIIDDFCNGAVTITPFDPIIVMPSWASHLCWTE